MIERHSTHMLLLILSHHSKFLAMATWIILYQGIYGKKTKQKKKTHTSQLLSVVTYPVCNITVMITVRVDI